MIRYVDTSALVKLLVVEEHSDATEAVLDRFQRDGDPIVSSAIVLTELHRSAVRLGILERQVHAILTSISLVACTNDLLLAAARLPDVHLRSLDAIHVASALEIEAATFVSFDDRQILAAERAGLVVLSPSG